MPIWISGVRSSLQSGYRSPSSSTRPTRLDSAHSSPPWGSCTTTSTCRSPASRISASAASTTRAATRGSTTAAPRSTETTARLPARSMLPSPASQPDTRGQAEGVPGVEAVGHVEPAGRVAHRAGQAAQRDGQRGLQGLRSPGDAPVGGLQPEQAGEPGRDADRPAPVATRGDGQQAPGHRGGGPARGAAGRPVGVPRVPGDAVQLGGGAVDPAELRGRGLCGEDGAGRPQPRHVGRVEGGHAVGEHERGLAERPALDVLELLHARSARRRRGGTRRPQRPAPVPPRHRHGTRRSGRRPRWRPSEPSSASRGLRVPARKASTSEQASCSHGSVMRRTYPRVRVRRGHPRSALRGETVHAGGTVAGAGDAVGRHCGLGGVAPPPPRRRHAAAVGQPTGTLSAGGLA